MWGDITEAMAIVSFSHFRPIHCWDVCSNVVYLFGKNCNRGMKCVVYRGYSIDIYFLIGYFFLWAQHFFLYNWTAYIHFVMHMYSAWIIQYILYFVLSPQKFDLVVLSFFLQWLYRIFIPHIFWRPPGIHTYPITNT
jgi:hypothetical protein